MLCYKDITFCSFENCKGWKDCKIALTDEVKKKAEEWMKNPPICVYADKPDCWEGENVKAR